MAKSKAKAIPNLPAEIHAAWEAAQTQLLEAADNVRKAYGLLATAMWDLGKAGIQVQNQFKVVNGILPKGQKLKWGPTRDALCREAGIGRMSLYKAIDLAKAVARKETLGKTFARAYEAIEDAKAERAQRKDPNEPKTAKPTKQSKSAKAAEAQAAKERAEQEAAAQAQAAKERAEQEAQGADQAAKEAAANARAGELADHLIAQFGQEADSPEPLPIEASDEPLEALENRVAQVLTRVTEELDWTLTIARDRRIRIPREAITNAIQELQELLALAS